MMFKRVFIVGSLVLVIALLAVSNVDAGTEKHNYVQEIYAYSTHTDDLDYLDFDTRVTIDLEDATQPISFYVYFVDYYADAATQTKSNGNQNKILEVYNVESGNWTFTVNNDGDYYVVFVNENPEPVSIRYSIEIESEEINEGMLWGILAAIICITLIMVLIPVVMMVVMIIVIIVIIKMVTDNSKKKQQQYHRGHPQGEPYYYHGEEAPRKKGKSSKKKK